MRSITCGISIILAASVANADFYAPPEAGTVVSGYQDSFDTLSVDWTAAGGTYTVNTPGLLTVEPEDGESHLFLTGPSYDAAQQEVLALVRPLGTWDDGPDQVRGGVAVNGDLGSSQAYNLLLREKGENVRFLDDGRAWGPSITDPDWQSGNWYWLRLAGDGAGLLQAKFWDATTTEPADWTDWAHDSGRSGLAGIAAGTSATVSSTFEVDYFLLKSPGLPQITVTPEPASLLLLAMAGVCFRRR